MNNLAKLNALIAKGEKILETRTHTSRYRNICTNIDNTLINWGNECFDCDMLDVSLCQEWFKNVEEFLTKLKLKHLIEIYYNDDLSGNFHCFDKQFKIIKGLYELSIFLKNKKLAFKEKDIERTILHITILSDMWQSYLFTYQNIIGYDIFKEVMTNLLDKNYFNFNITWGRNDFRFVSARESPLTLRGKERLKYLNNRMIRCYEWLKNNWKWLITLIIGSGLSVTLYNICYTQINHHIQNTTSIIVNQQQNNITFSK